MTTTNSTNTNTIIKLADAKTLTEALFFIQKQDSVTLLYELFDFINEVSIVSGKYNNKLIKEILVIVKDTLINYSTEE